MQRILAIRNSVPVKVDESKVDQQKHIDFKTKEIAMKYSPEKKPRRLYFSATMDNTETQKTEEAKK